MNTSSTYMKSVSMEPTTIKLELTDQQVYTLLDRMPLSQIRKYIHDRVETAKDKMGELIALEMKFEVRTYSRNVKREKILAPGMILYPMTLLNHIRFYREITGAGLAEAAEYMDTIISAVYRGELKCPDLEQIKLEHAAAFYPTEGSF